MLIELESKHYQRVSVIFRHLDHHLAIKSMLYGNTKTRMFVDDAKNPRTAATWTGHRIYFVGEPNNLEFNQRFREVISALYLSGTLAGKPKICIVHYHPVEWEPVLEEMFSGAKVYRNTRHVYEMDIKKKLWDFKPPKGFKIEQITKELLSKELGNLDLVMKEMLSEVDSIEEFFGGRFGFLALKGKEVACWCMSEYNTADRFEVGIETVNKYRRMGLAASTAKALIHYAASSSYNWVGWHCWSRNEASVATALSLGLSLVKEYPVLFVSFEKDH